MAFVIRVFEPSDDRLLRSDEICQLLLGQTPGGPERIDLPPHGGEDPRSVDKPAAVALITYATSEDAVRRALAAIEKDGVLAEKPQVIRIEKG